MPTVMVLACFCVVFVVFLRPFFAMLLSFRVFDGFFVWLSFSIALVVLTKASSVTL